MKKSFKIKNGKNNLNTNVVTLSNDEYPYFFKEICNDKDTFCVIDGNFYDIYKDILVGNNILVIPSGEEAKSQEILTGILDFFIERKVNKTNKIFAIGGGATLDVVGFACSVYMRGIVYSNVPTTLLSMCDSCIGGKTAIDYGNGKNNVGSFYPPVCTVIIPGLIKNINEKPFNDGVGELLKYGLLGCKKIYSLLNKSSTDTELMVVLALKEKAKYVKKDFHDNDIRHLLNLGHTFAHAIEQKSNYTVTHGTAVGMGLIFAIKFSKAVNLLDEDFSTEVMSILLNYGINAKCPYSAKELFPYMITDKKSNSAGIDLILPVKKYKCTVSHYSYNRILEVCNKL